MPRRLLNYLVWSLATVFFGCVIARPILAYWGVDSRWIDLISLIQRVSLYVVFGMGLVSAVLLFTPKYRDRREAMERQIALTSLSPRVRIVSGAVFFGTMVVAIVATTVFVKDARLQALINGLTPFFLAGGYLVWWMRRARKVAAERKAKNPGNIFS